MLERERFIRADAVNEMWQAALLSDVAKTPDLSLHFCRTVFHLNYMFPLTICKARAALVSSDITFPDMVSSCEIWFQSIQMVEVYLLSLRFLPSLCTFPRRQEAESGVQVMEEGKWRQWLMASQSPAGFLMRRRGCANTTAEGNNGGARPRELWCRGKLTGASD